MTQLKFTSLADAVFDKLESDILTGIYKKGEVLTETELSNTLNVSRTPIREAVRRLEQENLLKETAKGHVVIGISPQDISDIYDIRFKIEGVATRLCAERITKEKLEEMREVIDLQEFYTQKSFADKIKGADSRFHELIYENCGSEIYNWILSGLHRKVQRIRSVSVSDKDRAVKAVVEHREIFSAIENGDGAFAEKLMIKHIENAKNNILRLE